MFDLEAINKTNQDQNIFVSPLWESKPSREQKAMLTIKKYVEENAQYCWSESSTRHRIDSVRKMEVFFEFEDYGSKALSSFRPSHIQRFFNHLKAEKNLSDSTVNRYAAAISSAFKFAVLEGLLDTEDRPLFQWKKIKSQGRPRYFSDAEIAAIDEGLRNHRLHSYVVHYFRLGLCTGMRKGEIKSIGLDPKTLNEHDTYGTVDRANNRIHLFNTKNGSDRSVALNKPALDALEALNDRPCDFYSDHTFYTTWREVADVVCNGDEAKLEHFVFHITRHTCATRLINLYNFPTLKVKNILGHLSISTTERYVHQDDAATDDSMALYGEGLNFGGAA